MDPSWAFETYSVFNMNLLVLFDLQPNLKKHLIELQCPCSITTKAPCTYVPVLYSVCVGFQLKQKGFSQACFHPKWALSPWNYFKELKSFPHHVVCVSTVVCYP